jgi:hypothetical protein
MGFVEIVFAVCISPAEAAQNRQLFHPALFKSLHLDLPSYHK